MTTSTMAIAPAPRLQMVPFHQYEILAAEEAGEVRVPMKRFCGTIGLPWDGQRQRIERTKTLRAGASMMLVPSDGGEQQQVALPLRLIPGFLVGVQTSRLQAEVRDRLDLFQAEAYDVLYRHFAKPAAAPVPVARTFAPAWQELDAARRTAPQLIDAISAERRPAVRRYLHELLGRDADRLGLDIPALDRIGQDGMSADALVERFVAGLQVLTMRRVKWNHLGKSGGSQLAIVLPEIERLFRKHDVDLPVDQELRDALDAGNRHYRVTRKVMTSELHRQAIFATVLAPWPVERSAEA